MFIAVTSTKKEKLRRSEMFVGRYGMCDVSLLRSLGVEVNALL